VESYCEFGLHVFQFQAVRITAWMRMTMRKDHHGKSKIPDDSPLIRRITIKIRHAAINDTQFLARDVFGGTDLLVI
jgi:hypothetical protein